MASSGLFGTNALRMGWRKRAFPAIAGVVILTLAALIHYFNPAVFSRYGNLLFDEFQRRAPREYQDIGVRVIDIDEESLDRLGQWPWPRPLIADMTKAAVDAGAGVIAFDIVFSEPDRTSPENLVPVLVRGGANADVLANLEGYVPHDEAMADAFSQLPVITGYFFEKSAGDTNARRAFSFGIGGEDPSAALERFTSVTASLDIIEEAAVDSGFVTIYADADAMVREVPLIATLDGQIYPSLSLATLRYIAEVSGQPARGYLLRTSTASKEFGMGPSVPVALKVGDFIVPTTARGGMNINFTKSVENRVIPAWKLLDPSVTDAERREMFEGSIVFVGAGAQGLRDLKQTPLDNSLPGVIVHAQALEQMLLGEFLIKPDWAPGVRLLAIILGGIILVLIVPIAGAFRSGLMGAVVAGGMFWMSWFLYTRNGLLFDPIYPAIALFVVYGITSLVSYIMTEAERSYIKDAFDLYLAPDMVDKIADDPGQLVLGGEERVMTILFSDIRSFSKVSEGMTPEQLTTYINRYLTPMTDILLEHRATVDKYIGDAIMSFWNAPLDDPDQFANAARSALAMMARLDELNATVGNPEVPPEASLPVETAIGIGIHAGLTSVGNMGSDQRFAYSVLGDTVNTASRLEGMTKAYRVGVLIGDALAERLEGFAVLELDRAQAVGKDEWLSIFALVGDEAVAQQPAFQQHVDRHHRFLEAYRASHFKDALGMLDELGTSGNRFGLEAHYQMMRERIEAYIVNPPPTNWEGVHVLRSK